MPESPVKDFYNEKSILITGATGFLGIALLEKLLRSCDVGFVVLLMRAKKGENAHERMEELKKNLIFEKLLQEKGEAVFSKVTAVNGDINEEKLGLSSSDRNSLIENTNIVFHCAATLDFEAGLRSAVTTNLLGTRRVVELCSEMKNLKALIHVSSAYVNSNRESAEEILYDLPQKADDIINLVMNMSDEALEEMTPKYLKDHPNSYTITKALAEHEIARYSDKFPCAIVRPSMIVAAWKEPTPGWTISKNGPQGFIMGASKGIVRRLPVKKDLIYDYIPVDVVVNSLIVAGWYAATNKWLKKELILHCTSSTRRPFTWLQVDDHITKILTTYPLKSAIWYPTMKFLPNLTLFRISSIIFHFIPAFFFDAVLKLTGGRPMLVRLHRKVNASLGRLAPFIFREWFFDNSKLLDVHQLLSDKDKLDFGLDISTLEWVDFFTNLVLGVRRYLHNEEFKTLEKARKKAKIFCFMNVLIQVLFFAGIWYLTSVIMDKNMIAVSWIVLLIYALYNIL